MSGLFLETCVTNLKSVALTVLELLAFNSHFNWSDWPVRCAQTDRQTDTHSNEHIISTIQFVHLAEIKIASIAERMWQKCECLYEYSCIAVLLLRHWIRDVFCINWFRYRQQLLQPRANLHQLPVDGCSIFRLLLRWCERGQKFFVFLVSTKNE